MVFGSAKWLLEFANSKVQHVFAQASDHSMLSFDTDPQQPKRKTRFIYDNRWSKNQSFIGVIQDTWNVEIQGSRMFKFHKRVKNWRNLLSGGKRKSQSQRSKLGKSKGR